VLGLFDQMALSALVIMLALVSAAFLLHRHGIDTRGIRLEDMHAALERKSER
jgi:MFS transporter, putative metabolite:H+ symporter